VLGLARRLNTDARVTLLEMVDTYGPVIDFGRGKYHYIYLLSTDANEHILSTDPANFTWHDAFQVLVPVNGETALVVSDGDDHQRRRRIVQPAFHMRRISSYLDVMVEETNQVIDQWQIGSTVDAYTDLRLAIRRIVLRCLFGDTLSDRDEDLARHLEVALAYVNRPPTQRFDWNLPGMPYRKAMTARRSVDVIVFEEIKRRRTLKDRNDDIISWLIADQEADDGLSDQEVRDQIVSLIAAGYDTTAAAMGWAAAELAANTERADEIRTELRTAGAGDTLKIEQISQLTYTSAFVQEVLRLHPPAIWSGRRVVNDFQLHEQTIPGGSMVLFSPHVTHHDPQHFPDPYTFRPERWLDGHPDQNQPHPYAYIPFGGGNRRCLGFAFATQELITMTALLAQRTDLELVQPGPQRHVGTMSSAPDGGTPIRINNKDN
jgi:cytochrome P450